MISKGIMDTFRTYEIFGDDLTKNCILIWVLSERSRLEQLSRGRRIQDHVRSAGP